MGKFNKIAGTCCLNSDNSPWPGIDKSLGLIVSVIERLSNCPLAIIWFPILTQILEDG